MIAVEAPSNLGLKPPSEGAIPGVRYLPEALRKTGIYERLGVQETVLVPTLPYRPEINASTKVRNAQAIREYSISLANAVEPIIRGGKFPLVIGGDCSILLGSALALCRLGQYGLFFMDGHTDFQTPETSRTGGAAGMDLALATGYGPELLTEFEGYKSLFDEKSVIAFGFRDDSNNKNQYPSQNISDTKINLCSLDTIRSKGISQTATEAVKRLEMEGIKGIWLHLDVDVLDDEVMPAVDSRQPGGLTYEEMTAVVQILMNSGLLVGMQITIFDPELDPDGSIVREFANWLENALKPTI